MYRLCCAVTMFLCLFSSCMIFPGPAPEIGGVEEGLSTEAPSVLEQERDVEPISEARQALREKVSQQSTYLWYFRDWLDTEWGDALVERAKDFGLVLIHPTNTNISPEVVKEIRRGHDGVSGTEDDVMVIGYISVGEDIRTDMDHDHPLETGDGKGPVYWDYEKEEKVYQNNGYPSYYLDDRDKDGLPDRNWQYQGCYSDPGNPDYQYMLKSGLKTADGFVGLDQLFTLYECDGVFLDTMDVANPLSWGFPFYFEWVASGGQQFIRQLREWYPDKLILLNRTLVYFDPNQQQGDGTPYLGSWGKDIADDIDLLLFEGFYWPGDEVRNRNYWAPKINAEADRTGGFMVLALDYVGDANITLDGDFNDWVEREYLKQGVEKLDDALIWSKGVKTPNEVEDTPVPGIDIIDLWMANDPENIHMYLRVDFAGPIDFQKYNYYIYLDTDQSAETGFKGLENRAIGIDYLITDGDNNSLYLYKFTGSAHDEWSWEWTAPIYFSSNYVFEGEERFGLELAIGKEILGEENRFDEAVDLALFTEDPTITPYHVDSAPDFPDEQYYQYLSRTKELGFSETIGRQGWLSYNKPHFEGFGVIPMNTDALVFSEIPDTAAPVWDSTAASPGAAIPAAPVPRVGIQEAEPGDRSITVRWDTARDRSRPVTYTIYYSTETPIDIETAERIENVNTQTAGRNYYLGTGHRIDFPNGYTSPHGHYSRKIGEGVYPYEYTITGLENDVTYYCMVRASDHAVPSNTEVNTVELAATPRSADTQIRVKVNGNPKEWSEITALDYSPGEVADPELPPEIDILEIKVTEDKNNLYFFIEVGGDADFGKMKDQLSILLDTDTDEQTGYSGPYIPDFPWSFGADLMIQNGNLYTHTLMNGYRIWNWEVIEENGKGKVKMSARDGYIEVSVNKLSIGNPQVIHMAIETDRILPDCSHLIDRAPNDYSSHYYSYTMKK